MQILRSMKCRKLFFVDLSSLVNWRRLYLRQSYVSHLVAPVWANISIHQDTQRNRLAYQWIRADMNSQPEINRYLSNKLKSSHSIIVYIWIQWTLTWYPFLWWKPITIKCKTGVVSFAISIILLQWISTKNVLQRSLG